MSSEGRRAPSRLPVVGRREELAVLGRMLDRAAAGAAAAVLVSGEAGIGKTVLCRTALASWSEPDAVRLAVSCLPLHGLTSGLAPLRSALRRCSAPVTLTRRCLERMDAGDPIRAVDDWVEEVLERTALVVVVDDVQWAGASLRDSLLYLLAGPAERRLAGLITARTEGLPDGHALHGWIADLLRFPQVSRLRIGPLTRADVEAQLSDLLGARPHQSLVDDVSASGRGNPFFTAMLVQGVSPEARHLPTVFPRDLVDAVTGIWHGCSPAARTVTRLLATAGEPQPAEVLAVVARDLGRDADVATALDEARRAGLVDQGTDARFWFRHPLQAEVLERGMTDADLRRGHAAFARIGDASARETGGPSVETAVRQATRHDRAGSPSAAYRWAIRAWELSDGSRSPELRRVLRRAIELRGSVPEAAEEPVALWERLLVLAADAGAFAEELEALDSLIALTDEARQPLRLSRLLVRRMLMLVSTGAGFYSIEDMSRAVALASVDPSSAEYALALAEFAHAAAWLDDPQARSAADRAVAVARSARDPCALSFALTASSMIVLDAGDPGAAAQLAAEAADAALVVRDWWGFVHAVMWESNALPTRHSWSEAEYFARRRAELTRRGGPDPYTLQLAAVEAEIRLELGDPAACESLLRESVTGDPGLVADVRARLALARLAAYRGRSTEAVAHVQRSRELFLGRPHFRSLNLEATSAIVLLEAGRPEEAYDVAYAAAVREGVAADMAEYLMPLAARALADQVQRARDHGRSDADLQQSLRELRTRFPALIVDRSDPAAFAPLRVARLAAMQSWYDAETARARGGPDEPARWAAVSEQCTAGQLPWLKVYSDWRAAEAYLGRGRTGRPDGVRYLRAAYGLAVQLGAERIRTALVDLGRLVHVNPAGQEIRADLDDPRLTGLTPREREIVDLLCAGLTYAEIATTLVISEKTVSSHVSNVLRKTTTSNRVELTRLVGRVTEPNRSSPRA